MRDEQIEADGEAPQQRPEKEVRADLKRVLFARAPLFVRMRALIRREVLAEIAAEAGQ